MKTTSRVEQLRQRVRARATADDGTWFAQNPSRKWRLRDLIPGEFPQPLPAPPADREFRTVVYLSPIGQILRTFVKVRHSYRNDEATDAELEASFQRGADANGRWLKEAMDTPGKPAREQTH